ncbi:MAG: two-component system, OmpR family, response regulator [Acidobacteriota bacterium]|jgi:two-component system response regulator CpxR|nr:two-component system, OmpR family, response regulator [Acidobacteriota bacterium]MDT5268115.1 two-component system, OmpR family, response regulator [Acidobacteriota bacterium]
MESVLIVDDDSELTELVGELLDGEGFRVEVSNRSERGLERALSGEHSLVVLDVMMPGMNGFEVLRRLRAEGSRIPVLMLTARGEDVDRIVGLEIGADDYLPKPFNPRELVARINAILRRVRSRGMEATTAGTADKSLPDRIEVGDVEIDTGTRHVRRAGASVELTNVEYEILVLLLSSAGRVLKRDELVRSALGRELSVFDRSIDMHVSHLRKKLGPRTGEIERIKTVRGVGYIYARPVEKVEGA